VLVGSLHRQVSELQARCHQYEGEKMVSDDDTKSFQQELHASQLRE
jgi:hypothetical protein